jgi:hypothetical protein
MGQDHNKNRGLFFLDETSDCMIMPRVERIYEMAGRKEAGSVILANNHVN